MLVIHVVELHLLTGVSILKLVYCEPILAQADHTSMPEGPIQKRDVTFVK